MRRLENGDNTTIRNLAKRKNKVSLNLKNKAYRLKF